MNPLDKSRSHVRRWFSHSAAVVLFIAGPALGQGLVETIAIQGDEPPDENGFLAQVNTPLLNDAGQVAFTATLINTADGPDDAFGIFRGSGGPLTQIAREYQLPGFGLDILDLVPAMNNSGQVAFRATFSSVLGGSGRKVYVGTGGPLTEIAGEFQAGPIGGGTFASFDSQLAVNDAGHVAFRATLTNTANTSGIFRGDGSATTQIVRSGDTAPNGIGQLGGDAPAISDSGDVAFYSEITVSGPGIFRGSGGAVTRIVRFGQAAPDNNGSFNQLVRPFAFNDSSQAVFWASISNYSGEAASGIFVGSGGTITQIVRRGDSAPDGDGWFSNLNYPSLNDGADVAFTAGLNNTAGGPNDDRGLFLSSGGNLVEVALRGEPAPGGNAVFYDFRPGPQYASVPMLNDTGQVAFLAVLQETISGGPVSNGIFMADGQEVLRVAREGDPLAGSTIETLAVGPNGAIYQQHDRGGLSGINRFAQLAFTATLQNGQEGIFLFTPELHWRTPGSGDWDDRTNWTVSIEPAQVHPVVIDPEAPATVLGPAAATTVRSLALGGDAVLELQPGGTLTVDDGLNIETGGTLAGDGTIAADVANGGTLAPGASVGAINVNGLYSQTGSLVVQLESLASFDTITVTGDAMLGGDLAVELLDAYLPNPADTFTILTAATLTGAFDNVAHGARLDTLGGDGSFLVSYDGTTNAVLLSDFMPAVLAGDYNGDGTVDAADYTVFRDNLGTDFNLNGNGDETGMSAGVVDGADYDLWVAHFGETAGSGAANFAPGDSPAANDAVPEPASWLLLAGGLFMVRRPAGRITRC